MRIPLKYICLVFVLLSTPLLAWLTVYGPTNEAVKDVSSEIKVRTRQLANISEVNSQYRKIKNAIEIISNASEVASAKIPMQHQAEQWLGEASAAAERSGLVVRSVTITGKRGDGEIGVLPVNMEVSGTFAGVYGLVQQFEQMDRLIPINRLDIRRNNDASVDATLVLHLLFSDVGDEK